MFTSTALQPDAALVGLAHGWLKEAQEFPDLRRGVLYVIESLVQSGGSGSNGAEIYSWENRNF